MPFPTLVPSMGGGGATEYDSLSDLPDPTSGAVAVVGGSVLVATATDWEYVTLPLPMVPVATAMLGNVANIFSGLVLNGVDVSEIGLPSSTTTWSAA